MNSKAHKSTHIKWNLSSNGVWQSYYKSWEYSFDLLKNDGETNKAKIQDWSLMLSYTTFAEH